MSIWDNQQETSWFIGILEADGDCINTHLTSGQTIRVSNTDTNIIETCCSFLKKKSITFGLYQRPLKKRYKQLVTISICGKNNCYTLLKYLGDGFQCRKQEFQKKLFGSSTTTRDVSLTPDLHWLIGVFEGEGCFSLDLGYNTYMPRIRFVNTNNLIIEKYIKTLYENSLSWYVYKRVPSDLKYKISFEISITGMLRCQRFLTKLKDLWRSKIYCWRANKLLDFISSRLTMKKGSPYTESQIQIFNDLRLKR